MDVGVDQEFTQLQRGQAVQDRYRALDLGDDVVDRAATAEQLAELFFQQRLVGGLEEGGFVLDAEVGLFAMKKEQVAKALVPLTEAGIEVDILQLSPMALLNMLVFDQMPDPTTIDPLEPPPSVVLWPRCLKGGLKTAT